MPILAIEDRMHNQMSIKGMAIHVQDLICKRHSESLQTGIWHCNFIKVKMHMTAAANAKSKKTRTGQRPKLIYGSL